MVINMKKELIIICFILIALSFSVFTSETFDSYSSDEPEIPGFIILAHANKEGRIKITQERISILGACDPEFPLYINDEEVSTTAKGFFSVHVELEIGDNLFLFKNGEEVAEIKVSRSLPEPIEPEPPLYFEEAVYAIAANANISRFYERDDDNNPGTPLVKGTVFRITAEDGQFYQIHDGSYVFKSSVELLEEIEGEHTNSLYSVEMQAESAIVTLYHKIYEDETGIEFELNTESFEIPFEKGRIATGYSVEIADNKPIVSIEYALTDISEATVLLDAGHGGSDPGALGPPGEFGLMEKDFNLYVAQKTRDYLENIGINVIFPRSSDEHVPILERMEHFFDSYDIGVSIHANSMPMHHDFTGDEGPLMFYSAEHSEKAASGIIEHIAAKTGHEFNPAILRNFGIARYTSAPSMLFEMGYMCNPHEYERLLDTDYLDLIAESLGEGIVQYLGETSQKAREEFDVFGSTEPPETEVIIEESTVELAEEAITTSFTPDNSPRNKPLMFTIAFLAIVALNLIIRRIISKTKNKKGQG